MWALHLIKMSEDSEVWHHNTDQTGRPVPLSGCTTKSSGFAKTTATGGCRRSQRRSCIVGLLLGVSWRSGRTCGPPGEQKQHSASPVSVRRPTTVPPNARFMTERDKQELHSFCEGSPVLSEEVPARLPCGFLMTEYRVVCSGCRSDIPMENAWVRRARHEYSQHSIETWDVRGSARAAGCRPVPTSGSGPTGHSTPSLATLGAGAGYLALLPVCCVGS